MRIKHYWQHIKTGGRAPSSAPSVPMPFIVGSPRSGTTLLRMMLDAHPSLAIPPETGFLAMSLEDFDVRGTTAEQRAWFCDAVTDFPPGASGWQDFGIDKATFSRALDTLEPFAPADGFRLFYRMYAARFQKERWGDKTPLYGLHLPRLQQLLPEAYFIHIIRDGRGCAASLREQWFSPGRSMTEQALHWCCNVSTTRRHGASCRHYLEVRYEQLVVDTEAQLRRVCDFIQLEFHPAMLDYHRRSGQRLAEHRGRVAADGTVIVSEERRRAQQARTTKAPDPGLLQLWRSILSADEIHEFNISAHDLLCDLGYAVE